MRRGWLFLSLLLVLALPAWSAEIDPSPVAARAIGSGTAGAAGTSETDASLDDPFATETPTTLADPIEPVNRGLFWLNDKLYFYLFKPIARALRVIPEPVRISLGNVFSNLGTPVRFTGALLQLKFEDAGNELARFLINSTVGIGGLFDPAKERDGILRKDEDLGQTLGHYGVGQGFYLVLPVLGPTTLRDGVGGVGDYFLEPLPYWLESEELIGTRALELENRLSLDKDTYEGIKKQELDPYLFIRNAYGQRRAAQVRR